MLVKVDQIELLFGSDPRKDPAFCDLPPPGFRQFLKSRQFVACYDRCTRLGYSDRARDAEGRARMIAGRHHHADAGAVQRGDGLGDVSSRRVAKSHETEKGKSTADRFAGLRFPVNGNRDHSKALRRQGLCARQPRGPA